MRAFTLLTLSLVGLSALAWASSAPTVTNVVASQRSDGSGIVDIYYTLSDADNDECTVTIAVSDDSGATWGVTATALSGDIGEDIRPGRRHIEWASKVDLPDVCAGGYQFRVTANDSSDPLGLTWVYISDPGVPGHEGFSGYMSKYETTNAQFCQYLNAAKASGDIYVSGSYVKGNSGPYSGQDYYNLAGSGFTYNGATNGGAARINWTGSTFTVDAGFDNHPVTYVNWYGSMAFASYYGWRLPTEWEWQAVADYNGSYTYGCGTTISHSKANYYNSTHPHGTTAVGQFGSYGYGMADMAGNVWEWTSSCYYGDCRDGYRVLRGGSWYYDDHYCEVSNRSSYFPYGTYDYYGFRVCR